MDEPREGTEERGSSDVSTDSIEVPTSEVSSTEIWDTDLAGLEADPSRVEANIILIAHPENRMLGTRYRLGHGGALLVGRAPSAGISLPEVLSISRRHARLRYEGEAVTVEDLGSTNGTYVNDLLIEERTVLRSGDRFQIGAVHFKLLHEADVEHAYHHAIYQLVERDGLTEVFNRRKFEVELGREFGRAVRYGRPLSLILIDLDHFKKVNDELGHLCGDFVLKQLAGLCAGFLRPEQVFARVGGEEFAILSPETGTQGASVLAEKLRERIAHHEIDYAGCRVPVTCSFGVAELGAGDAAARELYERADRALYRSKREGRNRVTVAAGDA